MAYDNKILLIDDDKASRQDLQVILSFLGEPTVTATSADWQHEIADAIDRPEQVALVLIANCADLQAVIESIHSWEQGTPIILLNDQPTPAALDGEIASRIIATLSAPLSYQPLLDALHKAKVFHEHFNRLRDFDGVRDFNMFHSLVGNSPAIQQVRYMMGQVANTEVSVLITGES
ncbi:MAG: sigma-54-dependent Fis family transcriptional regulator, partial [Gammaproteobacteria bacterium]